MNYSLLKVKHIITCGDINVKKVIITLTLLIVSTGCYASQTSEEESEKGEIEFCRKTVKDQDNDVGRAIFTATCEDMEEDFKKKYGYTP